MENHKHRSISLSEQIFEKLENDILIGKYKRGEVLTEIKLSEELGVSRTPIREALHRLAAEHIIEESSKGSIVLGITEQDVKDIFDIRLKIEGLAAAGCAKNIKPDELAELKEAVELQEFYIARGNVENIRIMDSRFHELLYEFCGSAVLQDVLVPLHRKTQKYRHVSVSDQTRAEVSLGEHKLIFDAIEKGDVKKAEAEAVKHITNAAARILGKEAK